MYLGENTGSSPSDVKNAFLDNATKDVVLDPHGSPNKLLYVNVSFVKNQQLCKHFLKFVPMLRFINTKMLNYFPLLCKQNNQHTFT